MNFIKTVLLSFLLLITVTCWAGKIEHFTRDEEQKFTQTIGIGTGLLSSGKASDSIQYFNQVILPYELKYSDAETIIYCARDNTESFLYAAMAAVDHKKNPESNTHKDSEVISSTWAYAYYYKAYALIESKNISQAKLNLERAISLSPYNPQFLLEQAHIYQIEKNWDKSIEFAKRAEDGFNTTPQEKNITQPAAWRVIAYSLVEQGKLDEAEIYYQKCLALNPNDSKAQNELKYIQQLKSNSITQAK